MSEVSDRLLLLLVPPQREADPAALRELARLVGDEYGARLWVRPLEFVARACRLHLIGDWGRTRPGEVQTALTMHVEAAFFTLDWLDEAG
jgi:hypothetical protein